MIYLPGKFSDFVNIALSTARKGKVNEAKSVLELRPDWIHRIGPHSRTMLWEATYRGRTETVAHLLERGTYPHVWGCYFTPLFVEVSAYVAAVWKTRQETARLLKELYQPSDIFSATFLGKHEKVRKLIEEEPDIVNRERLQHDRVEGFTTLHNAISGGYSDILKFFLQCGANAEPYVHLLVKFAIWRNETDTLGVLLEFGIVPNRMKWDPVFANNLDL